jgi:hypothetical protein
MLSARGIGLGTEFIVLDHHDDGSISLELADTTCTLGPEVVRAIRVEP